MKLRLQIAGDSPSARSFESAGPILRLGRDPKCELVFDAPSVPGVSSEHAKIELTPGGAFLTDLGSTNGTFVNDRRVTKRTALKVGDYIRLGQAGPHLRVVELDLTRAAETESPAPVVRPAVRSEAVADRRIPAKAPVAAASPRSPSSPTRRMLRAMQGRQRKTLIGVVVALACLLGLVAGFWGLQSRRIAGVEDRVGKVEVTTAKQGGKIDEIEKNTWDMAARLAMAEGHITELTAAQIEMQKRSAESLADLQRGMDERLKKMLTEPTPQAPPTIAAGTTLKDALEKFEQQHKVTIVLDEDGFRARGVTNLGGKLLRQAFSPGKESLETILRQLLDHLEPIAVASRDTGSTRPSLGRIDLAPTHLLAAYMLVALRPPDRDLFPIPVRIERRDGYIVIAPATAIPPPERHPPARLEDADWSAPQPAVLSIFSQGGTYGFRGELLSVKPPVVHFRALGVAQSSVSRPFRAFNWIRTKENLYMYNRTSNRLDPVFTHYKFTQGKDATESFFRQVSTRDSRLNRWTERFDAIVELSDGASFPALVAMDNELEKVISLPFDNPPWIPAERIRDIRTMAGIWRYDQKRKNFTRSRFTKDQHAELLEKLRRFAEVAAASRKVFNALRKD